MRVAVLTRLKRLETVRVVEGDRRFRTERDHYSGMIPVSRRREAGPLIVGIEKTAQPVHWGVRLGGFFDRAWSQFPLKGLGQHAQADVIGDATARR
jgi:hypothetical protein